MLLLILPIPYPTLYPTLPNPTLPNPTLPNPTLPNPTPRYPTIPHDPSLGRHECRELQGIPVLLRVDDPLQDEQLFERRNPRPGAHRGRWGVERPRARLYR